MINNSFSTQFQLYACLLLFSMLGSCDIDKLNPFRTAHPHQQYVDKLNKAGLTDAGLGHMWIMAAEYSLRTPLGIKLPYTEEGYFAAELPDANSIAFEARRGEKIAIQATIRSEHKAMMFVDLWKLNNGENELLTYADSTGRVEYEIRENGTYAVRLQPELLQSVSYRLTITTGPSLAFPVKKGFKANIGSLWGVDRDGGARRHEGIDIFAAKGTPAVAAYDGLITAVNENRLGGKVVWLRPKGRSITLYYAHLDTQMAHTGKRVKAGEVIGLIGNTGNARTTPPHLHFGIYTPEGAVDPLPFVNQKISKPQKITASVIRVGKELRLSGDATFAHSLYKDSKYDKRMLPIAATGNQYKVMLPDGSKGFVSADAISSADVSVRRLNTKQPLPILDAPNDNAAIKRIVTKDLVMLAAFDNYYYISDGSVKGWIHRSHFN
jgi:murein DD-endopeptidase MepM/ murein hydrolase activator NlpD